MKATRGVRSQKLIGLMPLSLTNDQATLLRSLIERVAGAKALTKVSWAKRSKSLGLESTLELDAQAVGVTSDAIELSDGTFLRFAPGYRVTGFNPTKDRVFLTFQKNAWSAALWFKPRAKKKQKKKKHQEKLYDKAGLFVTGATGHRVWSGGLPSLGKRR